MIRRKTENCVLGTYIRKAFCILILLAPLPFITVSCAKSAAAFAESTTVRTTFSSTVEATAPPVTSVVTVSEETTSVFETVSDEATSAETPSDETTSEPQSELQLQKLVKIPYETRYEYSDEEYADVRRVISQGSDGLIAVVTRTGSNGINETVEEILFEAHTEVILIGTKPIYTFDTVTVTEDETAFEVMIVYDDGMYEDEQALVTEGSDGFTVNTYKITYERGKEVQREIISSLVTPPVCEVDKVGTKPIYTYQNITATENITAFSVKYVYDSEMYEGERVTATEGSEGFTVNVYRITYERGNEISRVIISTVTTSPVDTVIKIGTKKKAESFIMPFIDAASGGVDYAVTQYFGGDNNHGGIDFGVYYGNAIIAAMSGTVIYAYNDGYFSTSDLRWSYGTYVVIDHGNGYLTYYAHLSKKIVSAGDTVSQGQVIGYSGNTGRVSPLPTADNPYAGTHLHFEIRKLISGAYVRVDPTDYLPRWN